MVAFNPDTFILESEVCDILGALARYGYLRKFALPHKTIAELKGKK